MHQPSKAPDVRVTAIVGNDPSAFIRDAVEVQRDQTLLRQMLEDPDTTARKNLHHFVDSRTTAGRVCVEAIEPRVIDSVLDDIERGYTTPLVESRVLISPPPDTCAVRPASAIICSRRSRDGKKCSFTESASASSRVGRLSISRMATGTSPNSIGQIREPTGPKASLMSVRLVTDGRPLENLSRTPSLLLWAMYSSHCLSSDHTLVRIITQANVPPTYKADSNATDVVDLAGLMRTCSGPFI